MLIPSPSACLSGNRREGISFIHLVVRVRINLLWCVIGVVGATSG
jgi:hypothetical protein